MCDIFAKTREIGVKVSTCQVVKLDHNTQAYLPINVNLARFFRHGVKSLSTKYCWCIHNVVANGIKILSQGILPQPKVGELPSQASTKSFSLALYNVYWMIKAYDAAFSALL